VNNIGIAISILYCKHSIEERRDFLIIGQYSQYNQHSNLYKTKEANNSSFVLETKKSDEYVNPNNLSWNTYIDRKSNTTFEYAKMEGGTLFSIEDGKKLSELSGGDPKKMFDMVAEMGGYLKNYDGVSVKHIKNLDPTMQSQVMVTFPNGEYLIGETTQNKEDFFNRLTDQINNNNLKSKEFWNKFFRL